MLYMLDTNVCIYLLKKNPLSYFEKLEYVQQENDITISSIVLAELQFGVSNSLYQEQSQNNLNILLTKLNVLPFTEKCAFYYGEIRRDLKRKGCIIGGNDLLIASHAFAESAILVTNNGSEFGRIEKLKLENWA